MADVKKTRLARPVLLELATNENDLTQGYIDKLMQPEDAVLLERGGGDVKIYRELLRDDQVLSTWQQRRLALTSKETIVDPGGTSALDKKAAESLHENLQSLDWDRITDRMMYGIFYGHMVGEIMWAYDGKQIAIDDIRIRRPGRFRFGQKGELYLLTKDNIRGELMQSDTVGTVARGPRNPFGPKFWTYRAGGDNDDNYYGLGIGHQLYWPVFFKRNDVKFWLTFLEKFASPTVMGKLPGNLIDDAAKRTQVLNALQAIQSDAAIVLPESVEVELVEAARSGTADYAGMYARMNAAISKIVLSQTMTTDDGSSRSQAEVHKDVRDEVVMADSDLLCNSFNRSVARWWTEINYPGAAIPKVWRQTQAEEDIGERAERDTKVYALGFEPTEDYIKETYGEGWVKKAAVPASGPFGVPPDNLPPEFAEAISEIARSKISHRANQANIVTAAAKLASQYEEIIGPRLNELLAYAEESGDLLTFRDKLNELVAELPKQKAVDKIQRAGLVARLMGAFSQQPT
jgi:phage gp29-like protein